MELNTIQLRKVLSFPEFQHRYGAKAQCEEGLGQFRPC